MMQSIQECKDCQHEEICKWTTAMTTAVTEATNITDEPNDTPIKVKVTCDRYSQKARKQDGFNFKR